MRPQATRRALAASAAVLVAAAAAACVSGENRAGAPPPGSIGQDASVPPGDAPAADASDATDASDDASDGGVEASLLDAGASDASGQTCTKPVNVGPFDISKGVCTAEGFCQLSVLPIDAPLEHSWAASNGDVWVSGQNVIARWDGTRWSGLSGLDFPVAPAIAGSGPDDVWFGGVMRWDGAKIAYAAKPVSGALGMWFATSSDGWAVDGTATARHWDGATWTASPTGAALGVRAVKGFAANDVWAVGGPSVRHWTGAAWVDPPTPFPAGLDALSIGGASPDDFWVGAATGLVHYVAGVWTVLSTPNVRSIAARTTSDVLFASGSVNLLRWDGTQIRTDRRPTSDCSGCTGCTSTTMTPTGEVFTTTRASTSTSTSTCPVPGHTERRAMVPSSTILETVEYKGTPLVLTTSAGPNIHGREPDGSAIAWGFTTSDHAVGLSAASPDDIWISASYDNLSSFTSHFDGVAWTRALLPATPTSAVGAASPTSAWVLMGTNAAYWDGASWVNKGPVTAASPPRAIWGSANDAWAVGDTGIHHWDGVAWASVAGAPTKLVAVTGSASGDVVVLRRPSTTTIEIHRRIAGVWTLVSGASPVVEDYVTVQMLGPNDVWASDRKFGSSERRFLHWDGACWQTFRPGGHLLGDPVIGVGGSASKVWGYTSKQVVRLDR